MNLGTAVLDAPQQEAHPPARRPAHVARDRREGGACGRLPVVLGVTALALSIEGVADGIGYEGRDKLALDLMFVGVLLIFFTCAWRLLGRSATPWERRRVVMVFGLSLVVCTALASPLLPTGFDEMLHETTLWQLPYFHHLFTTNTVLPISPYYPGLELVTLGVKAVTGLPSVAAEYLVIGIARLILVLSIYLLVARFNHSERAGGLAVLAYALSPQFFAFNAAYAYQTLALAFATGAVYLLFATIDRPEPRADWQYVLALACLGCLALTHHLVGWLTAGFLVVCTLILARRGGNRASFRLVGLAALVAVGSCGLWALVSIHELVTYLEPILYSGASGLFAVFHRGKTRQLFHGGNGYVTPFWQQIVIGLGALIIMTVIFASMRSLRRQGLLSLRRGRGRGVYLLAAIVALGYPFVLLGELNFNSAQAGQRSSTFVFFGVAFIAVGWLLRRPPALPLSVLCVLATVAFLGSLIFGSGPSPSYVPGPYLPSADSRSIDAASLEAANWAAQHLPVDSRIAADRDNSALLAAIGHLEPVTEVSGSVNVGPIYFDPVFGRYDAYLVRKGQIHYLLVDQRLADGPPQNGLYFEPGETQGPDLLTHAELAKFSSIPGFQLIYNNGPIQIYDLSSLLHTTPTPPPTAPVTGFAGNGANLSTVAGFIVVACMILSEGRRRRWYTCESFFKALAAATVGLFVLGLLVVYARLPDGDLSPGVVLAGTCVLWWIGRALYLRRWGLTPPVAAPLWPRRPWGPITALIGFLLVASIAFDVVAAQTVMQPTATGSSNALAARTTAVLTAPATFSRRQVAARRPDGCGAVTGSTSEAGDACGPIEGALA